MLFISWIIYSAAIRYATFITHSFYSSLPYSQFYSVSHRPMSESVPHCFKDCTFVISCNCCQDQSHFYFVLQLILGIHTFLVLQNLFMFLWAFHWVYRKIQWRYLKSSYSWHRYAFPFISFYFLPVEFQGFFTLVSTYLIYSSAFFNS